MNTAPNQGRPNAKITPNATLTTTPHSSIRRAAARACSASDAPRSCTAHACSAVATLHRIFPVWPREYRPG